MSTELILILAVAIFNRVVKAASAAEFLHFVNIESIAPGEPGRSTQ